ncbi:aldo/keto reductase [Listeria monocytogenes]|uniref:aldo/keto reductase n=2 Tax=Listeria monocytogenes TaxID=1639 RepID=UPI0010F0CAB3|nr:aldo/keto reductase [Listeria monocytogenes]EAD7633095.1 aldo/keto reductase [Listeria monocytogenes]EAD7633256.1 aldo/keto reductase [Listeria monocytogenes]TYV61062.1 aldo/keto reductase [Listeria monocytogenes]HAO6010066.1 aldo/keto reductase [Listeria monocytogenes]
MNRTITLANGVEMPRVGMGVFQMTPDQAENATKWALEAGYRSIDTAQGYNNEEAVGKGLIASGVPREEVFITTKVRASQLGYEATKAAFYESLEKLQLNYIDLFLIHWPKTGLYNDAWRVMEELYEAGKIRAIGVSNFLPEHLDQLLTTAKITPMINQIEVHPMLTQVAERQYNNSLGIITEAYCPLGSGRLLSHPALLKLAEKYGKTTAQLMIRWEIQNDIVTIPKSVNHDRIKANFDVWDFEISEDDIQLINDLNENKRVGTDPHHFMEIFYGDKKQPDYILSDWEKVLE